MNQGSTRDLIVGLFVLAGLIALAFLSLSVGGLSLRNNGGMMLYANFDQIGGLKPRAPVMISGVKVGQVEMIKLADDFRARVELDVDPKLQLPVDSSASILTAGLLGDQYILLQPGGEEAVLKAGEEIEMTESAVILERLIGQFIHNTNIEKAGPE
ncbi:MAG TPA: outer membrane lipid asymmetry maintenance protein MlaD [Terriglobales bacterium]|nr:outer membrane lipid asymmetry maintenance protein MlaD [Terriglobales bacterium]